MLYHETLWVNDLDRNLLDTNMAFSHFVNVCVEEGVARRSDLDEARHATEQSGGSFDLTTYLAEQGVENESLEGLYGIFAETARRINLLYPDAQRFLSRLHESHALQLIMTYGEPGWQRAKIKASGLEAVPYIVTDSKYKGLIIADWQEDDRFRVTTDDGQEIAHHRVALTDDKAAAFQGLPTTALGYLVQRGNVVLASQAGEVPPHVRRISSMDQI